MFHFIDTGARHPEGRDMVFGSIHTEGPNPPYVEVPKEKRGLEVPFVLMLLRWDGTIGFPGGAVEPNEELIAALRREMREEINWEPLTYKPIPLCSLATETGDRHIHCFEFAVPKLQLPTILMNALRGPSFPNECQGCFLVQIAHFRGGGGILDFLNNNFKATAKMELEFLIRKYNWVPI